MTLPPRVAGVLAAAWTAFAAVWVLFERGVAAPHDGVLLLLATVALVASAALLAAVLRRAVRGPATLRRDRPEVRAGDAAARLARALASAADARGGAGDLRRWGFAFPAVAAIAAAGVAFAGIAQATWRADGRWIQLAGTRRALSAGEAYGALALGLLAAPSDVGLTAALLEISDREVARRLRVRLVDPSGATLADGPIDGGSSVEARGFAVEAWAMGPAVPVTVAGPDGAKVLEVAVPLWPGPQPGTWAGAIDLPAAALDLRVEGWPRPAGERVEVAATVRAGARVVREGPLEVGRAVYAGRALTLVAGPVQPFAGLRIARTAPARAALGCLAVLLLALGGWAVAPPRPYRFRAEEDGSVSISPRSAWALLATRAARGDRR